MDRVFDEDKLALLADFYKVFGDITRVKILCVLREGSLCVQDLADRVGMEQSAVSHQLRILKQMALVKGVRDGKSIIYALADDHIVGIIDMGMEHVEEDL